MPTIRADCFGGESAFNVPSSIEPALQSAVLEAESLCPVSDAERFTVPGNKSGRSAVAALLGNRRPKAILRRIALVVVSPLYRLSERGITHISKELFKLMPPSTNSNSASAVMSIGRDSAILTPLNHAAPDIVNPGSAHPMSEESAPSFLALNTPARSRGAKVNISDRFLGPAVALNFPCFSSLYRRFITDDNQPPKTHTNMSIAHLFLQFVRSITLAPGGVN